MTQILRDDQVRLKCFKQIRVNGIQALAARHKVTHLSVDLGGQCVFFDAGLDDDLFRASGRREIAFVAHADDVVTEAEGKENFCGRREKRDDAHDGGTLAQSARSKSRENEETRDRGELVSRATGLFVDKVFAAGGIERG